MINVLFTPKLWSRTRTKLASVFTGYTQMCLTTCSSPKLAKLNI